MMVNNDDEEDCGLPATVAALAPGVEMPPWFEQAMRPLLQRMNEFQGRMRQLEARVDFTMNRRIVHAQAAVGGCCSTGAPSPSAMEELSLFQAELRAKVESQDLELKTLTKQQEQLLADARASQVSLKEALKKASNVAGKAKEDEDLDFGAPIGKTFNTQDMAAMHAETRQELAECQRRISELADMVGGRPASGAAATNPTDGASSKAA
eukprot:CAMPEP_0176066326 /NCGR_PEP_ID=MMETSP0120_2-20121206/33098_1 /TAXON_ID=160619 /ORGANISM="Kryptoperidinium foliaceum, Strain CCMP 1326" /LENGTH=208 /DNA_ID=CAMNT_0017399929 /DNA_START=92 /DNA_END=715 /DNA_ORIENTATION=+